MAPLRIVYANGKTAAFTVASKLFYIKVGPDLPELYDHDLKRQIVPNIDYWFQAKTQQRYSFRGVCDMVEAFNDGVAYGYQKDDFLKLSALVFDQTIAYIFRTNCARSFARSYWIELMEERQIRGFISKIADGFDDYRRKYGDEKFYNYLCRLWKFCNFYVSSETATVERFISRLGKTPVEPHYPVVPIEEEIKAQIIRNDLTSKIDRDKNIGQDIRNNVDRIQAGRL